MSIDFGRQAGGQTLIEIILRQLLQLVGCQLRVLVRDVVVLVDANDALKGRSEDQLRAHSHQVDCTYVGLQESLGEQTLHHLSEASAHHGQEDTGNEHMIAGLSHASDFAATQHRHAAWNVAHWHLVTVLLHFELLELDELGAARLQIQTTAGLVHTAIIRGTILYGNEGQRVDGLICL